MKKIVMFMLMCMLLLPPAQARAAAPFETAGDLAASWREDYPAYITGVWLSGEGENCLTFGITMDDAGRAGAKEILEQVADDTTVSFAWQKYPLVFLYAVQEDVEGWLHEDVGFRAVGVYFPANRVEVDVSMDRLDDPATAAAIQTLTERYGDAVYFEFTTWEYRFVEGTQEVQPKLIAAAPRQHQMMMLYFLSAVCVMLLGTLLLAEYRRRRLLVLLTGNGTAVTRGKVSRQAIESAVRKSAAAPSPETEDAIFRKIQESGK